MRARAALLAAVLATALIAGCGDDPRPVPKGKPSAREGAAAIGALTEFEVVRARLLLVGDLWGLHRAVPALRWNDAARRAYLPLSPRVKARDPRLNAEILAAFDRIDARIRQNQSFDNVRDLLSPLSGQLLDGAEGAIGVRNAAKDIGVQAAVADNLLAASGRAYGPAPESFQAAYGFFARGQTLTRPLAPSMGGSAKHDVIDGGSTLRDKAYPEGVVPPRPIYPVPAYRQKIDAARAALAKRYDL